MIFLNEALQAPRAGRQTVISLSYLAGGAEDRAVPATARHRPRRLPRGSGRGVEDRLRQRGLPEPGPQVQVQGVPGLQGAPLLHGAVSEEGLGEAPGVLQGRPGTQLGLNL